MSQLDQLIKRFFPPRVWEPTGSYTEDGRPMFASRAATPADTKRRKAWLASQYNHKGPISDDN